MSNNQKVPFPVALQQVMNNTADSHLQALGQAYPCHVTAVNGAIVTVNFDLSAPGANYPPVTCPVATSKYVRVPIQIGDKGVCMPANARLGGVTGLGTGLAPVALPSNLGALVFVPLGNIDWEAVAINALFLRDADESVSVTIASGAVNVDGNMTVSGNLSAGNGITCSFTTVTGQTVTVQNGIVTNIF